MIYHSHSSLRDFSTRPDVVPQEAPVSFIVHLLFSALDVDEQEHDAHEEADGADGDVRDAEERVPAAEQRRRGDDHTFGAAELLHAKS